MADPENRDPPPRALGLVYWTGLWTTLAGFVGFIVWLLSVYTHEMRDFWPVPLAYALAVLWLAASAAWGRQRDLQGRTLDGEGRDRSLRPVRRGCWGVLLFLGLPGFLFLSLVLLWHYQIIRPDLGR